MYLKATISEYEFENATSVDEFGTTKIFECHYHFYNSQNNRFNNILLCNVLVNINLLFF